MDPEFRFIECISLSQVCTDFQTDLLPLENPLGFYREQSLMMCYVVSVLGLSLKSF